MVPIRFARVDLMVGLNILMEHDLRRWMRLIEAVGQVWSQPAADSGVFQAYHVSPVLFETFRRYSNFGSLRAAKTVLKIKRYFGHTINGQKIESVYLYTCRLHLVHPLRLSYAEANDDAKLFYAVRSGKYDLQYPQLRQWAADPQSRFEQFGFDAIIYPNNLDDGGKDSFVVFDPVSVQIISVRELTVRDFLRVKTRQPASIIVQPARS